MMKLLHVEDDPLFVNLVHAVFGPQDWEIVVAHSIEDTVTRIERNGFDCILLDLYLSDSFGLDGVRALRAKFPYIPIVGHSAIFDSATIAEARTLGVFDIIPKDDFQPAVIERSIRAAIAEAKNRSLEQSSVRILTKLQQMNAHRAPRGASH
jgi:DNA-binding NarL/FixJ family response regulator